MTTIDYNINTVLHKSSMKLYFMESTPDPSIILLRETIEGYWNSRVLSISNFNKIEMQSMFHWLNTVLLQMTIPSTTKVHKKLKFSLNPFSVHVWLGKRLHNHYKVYYMDFTPTILVLIKVLLWSMLGVRSVNNFHLSITNDANCNWEPHARLALAPNMLSSWNKVKLYSLEFVLLVYPYWITSCILSVIYVQEHSGRLMVKDLSL